MSKNLWDVIIVGGGPAGITAALRLARDDLAVLVVEAATYPGAENWSGAVYFAENLADPSVLGEAELERAPYERRVVKRGFFTCNGLTIAGAEYRDPETFRHCYTVLRPIYDRYLAERARQLGVTLLNETTADGLIRQGNRVIGVHTDRGPIYGNVVFLAEGDASHLVSKEGFERERVRSKNGGQPAFLQGVKEVVELDPQTIEERLGLGPGEACCYEILLRNGVVDGRPVRLNMAGFIYTNRSSVSIGLVLPLDNLAGFHGSYNTLMEWFKGLPPIQRLIAGGESTSYGAKIIRSGGLEELPKLVDDGVAVGGAATGIGIDFPYPNFTGPATAMGRLFAEAVLELRRNGEAPTAGALEELYVRPLKATHYYKDVEHLRDWPAFIEHSEALFSRQIDLLNGTLYIMTRPHLRFARKWWETTRLLGETLEGKWSGTIIDMHTGSKALRLGRYVLKHAPLALLLSVPNTLLALLPFTWGRGAGELRFSFWADGEETGRLPWFKRWAGARFAPALSKAAAVLYANDGRPLGAKLDRCVGLILRRLSLWEVLGALVGVLGFLLTRGLQRLTDAIRYARRRPTLEELKATFYGRWLTRWRALTDLAARRFTVARTHDAKLGEISYAGDPESHIKVFFPPAAPGGLEDPSPSALWSACPAAVYQINTDRTLHASVTVNFDNCVKCETCWRIEPQHVDWTRFGKHRLVYEVYTEADAALRRIVSERSQRPAPVIEASFWSGRLRIEGDGPSPAPAALEQALAAARRAIALAQAKCCELHEDVWNGPRLLEPGQLNWYRSAVNYFAALAEEAAAAATAEPITDWLAEHGTPRAQVEIESLRADLEALTARARRLASARRFFAAEADARQVRNHHLEGLRSVLARIAEACGLDGAQGDPVGELRAMEVVEPARAAARGALRERLAKTFDRAAVRRLEHGGALEADEVELLRSAARAALRWSGGAHVAFGEDLLREDILAELARADSSLAAIVAGHLAAVEALSRAGAPASVLDPLAKVERFATVAMESEAGPGDAGWHGRLPFVLSASVDCFVARGGGRVGLFEFGAPGVALERTPAIGLVGAAAAEVTLGGAQPAWYGEWGDADEAALFGSRARDLAAIALGAGSLMVERAIDHARVRIQFPEHFQDMDGRDAVAKFGAVRSHLAHITAERVAIETTLADAAWSAGADGLEARLAKVAVTDLFGPDLPSITYRTGQVIGGTAFSEDDVFAKIYRDSSVLPHYIRENARLNVEIGRSLTAKPDGAALLAAMTQDVERALDVIARRPILDFDVKRLREAADRLAGALHDAIERAGDDPAAAEAVHDVAGELATRLYVWLRLLYRAHRRLEGALPAQLYVEVARLWADVVEERLIALDHELAAAAERVKLGAYALRLGEYPDEPIATPGIDFDYARDIIGAKRGYRSGDFLLKPLELDEARYLPEAIWIDDSVRARYEEYLRLFRERFLGPDRDEPFGHQVERLHYIPREDIDWTRANGFFRVVIPQQYGGEGRTKADYYNVCMISKRLADVSHTLTIQANTSIGTTPILLGLYQDIPAAERDLEAVLARPEAVEGIERTIKDLLKQLENPDPRGLKDSFAALNSEAGSKLGRSRVLRKVVFTRFLSQLQKAGMAGLELDLAGFRGGLEGALAALEGWQERARAELSEIPSRRLAHEFYLRLISARMISAFALTEPSAGSDTARVRTEARLTSRRVHTDEDGVKYFYLDEEAQEGRRNLCDLRRFEFDGPRIFYRYSDDAEPAEVLSQEYTYGQGEEKYRYFMVGERRVDIHDMALIRERDGAECYEFFVLNGAKMWITNGHIAGVQCLYARTPAGVTGFMVDALSEGFFVGKDEEKLGQRGSPTNEITLTNVRVPRECMIGIEGRGQENALETLNVGRAGLAVSSAAGMQGTVDDVRDPLAADPQADEGWTLHRLGLALEEMFASESIAHNLIGLLDDATSDALRMESSIGKLFTTNGSHRMLHYLEPIYGIEGQTQRYRIEKDRRDGRVLTIYEGTNEIQQFLLLKDLIDMIGPKLERLERLELAGDGSPFAAEVGILSRMLADLHERLRVTRKTYGSAAWQRVLLQPVFFRLARMAALVKVMDSVVHRGHWIATHLTADGDAERKAWSEAAARGFVARAQREFTRLVRGFDRDIETLKAGGRGAELELAETVLDLADAAGGPHGAERAIERVPQVPRAPLARDLDVVVAMEWVPRLAPRPRLKNGRVAEHVSTFTAGDRRALKLALALKSAAPDRVRITLISAAGPDSEERLRHALAAGADRALLLDTAGETYAEHAIAESICHVLDDCGIDFDLLLAGASADSPSGGRLAIRLATECRIDWVPGIGDLWIDGDEFVCSSERFPETLIRTRLPAVGAVAAAVGEPDWKFTTAGFAEALRKPLDVIPFPADAERSDEEFSSAAIAGPADQGEAAGRVEPELAAEMLVELGDLGDGLSAQPSGAPYEGAMGKARPESLHWGGVVFVAEIEHDDLARDARAPLAAAEAIAARMSVSLTGLAMTEPLDDARRRALVGRLLAYAPFSRLVVAEHEALSTGSVRAYAEALVRLLGPGAATRPTYLLSSPWLADALPTLAEALREATVEAEELPGVSRIDFSDGASVAFVRPALDRKLRARRRRPTLGDGMRIVWCEPEVAADGGQPAAAEPEVVRVPLELDYDPQTDALAEALAEAKKHLGLVTLENAEFIIDVGAGLGSVDHLETLVEPLRQTLLELGAPHVVIGATRKVTMDMSWLPDEHQIGQTGVRVNPRVLIALGVSGAPQHLDYIGDRAVIFAFNTDEQAPLMTLNQRRESPKVYPVVGNLLDTLPKFIDALKGKVE